MHSPCSRKDRKGKAVPGTTPGAVLYTRDGRKNILKEMELIDIEKEKWAGLGDGLILVGEGRVIGLCT